VRASIALFLHLPGLRLLCGLQPTRRQYQQNGAAIAVTTAVIAAAVSLAPKGRGLISAISAWSVGHLVWGTYLAVTVQSRQLSTLPESPRDSP
jgi:hypothetical protein